MRLEDVWGAEGYSQIWDIYGLCLKDNDGNFVVDICKLIDHIEDDLIQAIKDQWDE